MKKIITVLLMLCLCMSQFACSNEQTAADHKDESESNQEVAQSESVGTSEVEEAGNSAEQAKAEKASSTDKQEDLKTLVVYFSNTGNTKAIAEKIADGLAADIYEIIPEDPYSDADLNYNDDNSRSTTEMNDPSARPAIAGSIENIEQYDTIYIGYPIWWGEAPRIMDTFVESYSFADMTVIPFCTSGGSGIGSSAKILEELAGSGNWMDGQRFNGSESTQDVMEWVNGQ